MSKLHTNQNLQFRHVDKLGSRAFPVGFGCSTEFRSSVLHTMFDLIQSRVSNTIRRVRVPLKPPAMGLTNKHLLRNRRQLVAKKCLQMKGGTHLHESAFDAQRYSDDSRDPFNLEFVEWANIIWIVFLNLTRTTIFNSPHAAAGVNFQIKSRFRKLTHFLSD